jgi:hypothetical protein
LRSASEAVEGDASDDRLLAVQIARGRASDPDIVDGWAIVEAHLLAARRDEIAAEDLLGSLLTRCGPKVLRRMERHGGAASPLAARMLRERGLG